MKKITLIVFFLCFWQAIICQEKEEEKKQEQKIMKEEDGPVVLKAYQNVTIDTKKEEKKKEEKSSAGTPFGIPFEMDLTLPEDFNPLEYPIYFNLRILKRKHVKDYYKLGSSPKVFFEYEKKKPSDALRDEKELLPFKSKDKKNFTVNVPSLDANKIYLIESTTISKISYVFYLIKQEGEPDYQKPKKWMLELKKINDEIKNHDEPLHPYYYPTKKKLSDVRKKLQSIFPSVNNLVTDQENEVIDLMINEFPILKCENKQDLDCPNFSRERTLRFAIWLHRTGNSVLTFDDTWVFADSGIRSNGIDSYIDYENVFIFYKDYLSSKLNDFDNSSIGLIESTIREELLKEIDRYNNSQEIPPNYLFSKDEAKKSAFADASTYPKSFETIYKRSITLDFGLSTFWLDSFEDPRGALFIGANVSLAPVNKNVPMALSDLSFKQKLAIHTGITITSLEENNKREDFFNKVSWMIGGSYKFGTQITRFNFGGILYNRIDAVSGNKSLGIAPYIGLSIDLEIGKWIQKSIPSVGGNFKK